MTEWKLFAFHHKMVENLKVLKSGRQFSGLKCDKHVRTCEQEMQFTFLIPAFTIYFTLVLVFFFMNHDLIKNIQI